MGRVMCPALARYLSYPCCLQQTPLPMAEFGAGMPARRTHFLLFSQLNRQRVISDRKFHPAEYFSTRCM